MLISSRSMAATWKQELTTNQARSLAPFQGAVTHIQHYWLL